MPPAQYSLDEVRRREGRRFRPERQALGKRFVGGARVDQPRVARRVEHAFELFDAQFVVVGQRTAGGLGRRLGRRQGDLELLGGSFHRLAHDAVRVEETLAAGASSLQFDALTGQYTYVWKTEKAWAGTCRQLVLTFTDGTTQRANFSFMR